MSTEHQFGYVYFACTVVDDEIDAVKIGFSGIELGIEQGSVAA